MGVTYMSVKEQVTQAIAAHGQWKVKFRDFMAGKLELDASVVQMNNQCPFGKWLEGEGNKSLPKEYYEDISRLHTEFHKVAADVIRKKKAGDVSGAQAYLASGGVFTMASATLTRKLMELTR